MKEHLKEIGEALVDVALIAGIIYLSANNKEGWGWLLLFLFIKN